MSHHAGHWQCFPIYKRTTDGADVDSDNNDDDDDDSFENSYDDEATAALVLSFFPNVTYNMK